MNRYFSLLFCFFITATVLIVIKEMINGNMIVIVITSVISSIISPILVKMLK